MSPLTKVLLYLFTGLFIVVIGEGIYYFYIQSKPCNCPTTQKTQICKPLPLPTHAPFMSAREIIDGWNFVWMKGLTNTATIITTNEGILFDMKINKGTIPPEDHEAKFLFGLQSITDHSISQRFYYKGEDVAKMKVVVLENGTEKKISLEDLRDNDKISLTISSNLYPEQGGKILDIKIIKE